MKPVVMVLVVGAALGGLLGGYLTGGVFTVIGASCGAGLLLTAAVLLGRHFHLADQKKRREELTPEMRGVFERLLATYAVTDREPGDPRSDPPFGQSRGAPDGPVDVQRTSPGPEPTGEWLPEVPGPPRTALPDQRRSSPDVARRIEVTLALAADLGRWLSLQRASSGHIPGLVLMHRTTGEAGDANALLAAHLEETALRYSLGLVAFLAMVRDPFWRKTTDCREVQARILPIYADHLSRQALPGLRLTPARLMEVASEQVGKAIELAEVSAHLLSRSVSEAPIRGGARSGPGSEALGKWLADTSSGGTNWLAFLQTTLATSLGVEFKGPGWELRLAGLYGPVTRQLLLRAIQMLDGPAHGRAV